MRFLSRFSAIAVLLIIPTLSQADTLLVCEDRDNDGRFGLVEVTLQPAAAEASVVRGNIGTYQSCVAAIGQQSACNGSSTLCACEDRDQDGRFGIVRHAYPTTGRSVIAPNLGNYTTCQAQMNSYPSASDRYLTCDDYDNDGRYGVVSHQLVPQAAQAQVLQANFGNYYACTQQISAYSQCQGSTYCACVDADQDGRFGIVWVNSTLVSTRVTQPNIGQYGSCFSRMNWSDWVN